MAGINLGVDPVSNIAAAAAKIISLFKLDPTVKAQLDQQLNTENLAYQTAELNAKVQEAQAELQLALGQTEVNKVEAGNSNLFVAGWRPYVGWVCGMALAYGLIIQPFAQFALVAFHVKIDLTQLPTLNTAEAIELLFPLLGLGAMRTYEKVQGVDPTNH